MGVFNRVIQMLAHFLIGLANPGVAADIEEGVVALLAQVDLLLGRFDLAADIRPGEITPVAVEAGADVHDHQVPFADNAVRGEAAVGGGVWAGADDVKISKYPKWVNRKIAGKRAEIEPIYALRQNYRDKEYIRTFNDCP